MLRTYLSRLKKLDDALIEEETVIINFVLAEGCETAFQIELPISSLGEKGRRIKEERANNKR